MARSNRTKIEPFSDNCSDGVGEEDNARNGDKELVLTQRLSPLKWNCFAAPPLYLQADSATPFTAYIIAKPSLKWVFTRKKPARKSITSSTPLPFCSPEWNSGRRDQRPLSRRC